MDERIKKTEKKSASIQESFHYRSNIEKLIQPYVVMKDEFDDLPGSISIVLDNTDNHIIEKLRSSDALSVIFSDLIKEIRDALKNKRISEDAPWFGKLQEKMLRFEIYSASTDAEMNLKKGREDLKKKAKEIKIPGYDDLDKDGPKK